MRSKAVLWFMLIGALSPAGFGQISPKQTAIPKDPLEMAAGAVAPVDAASRGEALTLLGRARDSYALRGTGRAYDLKVSFTVDSGGATEHDGAWQMEDLFDPQVGLRWTAKSTDGYAITRISRNGMLYGDESGSYVPLRLHEARAALFDPIPTVDFVNRGSLRTAAATYNGVPVTCILITPAGSGAAEAAGRRWEESEECIDPQSGLLQTHSQIAGRYYAYEYADGPQFAGHPLPRRVTVTEGGKVVTTISIDSMTELGSVDAGLFVPTNEMKAKGRPEGLGSAQKVTRTLGMAASGAAASIICVFGVMTPDGQLVEAHSLQPSDPNSAAAVEAVRQMSLPRGATTGPPQQHFVFVIGRYLPPQ